MSHKCLFALAVFSFFSSFSYVGTAIETGDGDAPMLGGDKSEPRQDVRGLSEYENPGVESEEAVDGPIAPSASKVRMQGEVTVSYVVRD